MFFCFVLLSGVIKNDISITYLALNRNSYTGSLCDLECLLKVVQCHSRSKWRKGETLIGSAQRQCDNWNTFIAFFMHNNFSKYYTKLLSFVPPLCIV